MTSEDEYDEKDEDRKYTLLKDLKRSVKSIEDKVEDILDELKEHFEEQARYDNEWHESELYDDEGYEM